VQQFSAIVGGPLGSPPIRQNVVWSASRGTIDATGKYTAPASVPDPPTDVVTATSVVDSRWSGSLLIVIVAAAGESVSLSGSPSWVWFGSQMVNTTSAPKAVTLTNTGGMPQPVQGRIDGAPGQWQDFAFISDCPKTLARGASCTFNITFTPSATGNRGATIFFDGFFDEEGFVNLGGMGTN
jgi:hypothetical protein